MSDPSPGLPSEQPPEEVAEKVAESYFGAGKDKASRNRTIRQLLLSSVLCGIFIPLLFYLTFGEIDGFGWGITIFFVVYCLLAAIGLYFLPQREYHTPVRLWGDWADRLGAFWLMACVFGPFLGWVVTSIFPLTPSSWRWVYWLRMFLAAVLPLITAIPLVRYLRGKATLIALPILVGITLLAVWSTVNVARDLLHGPILQQVQSTGRMELYLRYTAQSLGLVR